MEEPSITNVRYSSDNNRKCPEMRPASNVNVFVQPRVCGASGASVVSVVSEAIESEARSVAVVMALCSRSDLHDSL